MNKSGGAEWSGLHRPQGGKPKSEEWCGSDRRELPGPLLLGCWPGQAPQGSSERRAVPVTGCPGDHEKIRKLTGSRVLRGFDPPARRSIDASGPVAASGLDGSVRGMAPIPGVSAHCLSGRAFPQRTDGRLLELGPLDLPWRVRALDCRCRFRRQSIPVARLGGGAPLSPSRVEPSDPAPPLPNNPRATRLAPSRSSWTGIGALAEAAAAKRRGKALQRAGV